MKYVTIGKDEDLYMSRMKIKMALDRPLNRLIPIGEPQSFMGNNKVLSVRLANKPGIFAKIDGPGFIIDSLYEELR